MRFFNAMEMDIKCIDMLVYMQKYKKYRYVTVYAKV